GIFEWNHVEGRVTGSSSFFALYGSTEQSQAPMPWSAVHGADRPKLRAAFDAALDPLGDGRVDLVHRVLHPGGALRFLHLRAHTRFTADAGSGRRPLVTEGSVLDVTELERAREQLRHTEARFDEAVRSAQFGIFEHNHLEDPAAQNVYWSPRLREIFGVGPDEPGSAATLPSRVPVEDVEMLHAVVARAHDPNGE